MKNYLTALMFTTVINGIKIIGTILLSMILKMTILTTMTTIKVDILKIFNILKNLYSIGG